MDILPGLAVILGVADLIQLNNRIPQQVPVMNERVTQEANIEDFPFQVSVRFKDEYRCGGSIITENKILTAAHCVVNFPINELSVRIGSSKHYEGESIAVHSVALHPTFNQTNLDCDIAFLTLIRNLKFGRFVKKIELADERLPSDTEVYLPGWGIFKDGLFNVPSTLKIVTVRLIRREACKAWYPSEVITNRMVCGSFDKTYGDPCQGDSGGPVVDKISGKQIAVVSWGASCFQPPFPTVFASLPELIHSLDVI